jgi:5'-3' exonuclease
LTFLKYINYQLPYQEIYDRLKDKENIIIYIDLNSIAKGFYNRTLILQELNYYDENKSISNNFLLELRQYLGLLYKNFKKYNPKFIIFYDTGITQNSSIDSNYKANRTNQSKSYIQTDDEKELYYYIKDYYFNKVYQDFRINNTCSVIYLEDFETDLIPYFIISKNLLTSNNDNTLNLILSVDKDLLQTCKFKNTYQSICLYSSRDKQFIVKLYNNYNAMNYITKSNKSTLTSDYISLMLSIAGDKVDNIAGVYGLGPVKAEKLIKMYNLPNSIFEINNFPNDLINYKQKLINNFRLIDFSEQILRLPMSIIIKIENEINTIFKN